MKRTLLGFTLVEMIVGVSITLLLMISVGIFVSSGMKNITLQKQMLDTSKEIGNLVADMQQILSGDIELISYSTTGMVFQSDFALGKAKFYSFDMVSQTGYCQNDPEQEHTFLRITNFNPILWDTLGYSGSFIHQQVYSGGQVLAGAGLFGDAFEDGADTGAVYLNNPGGITAGGSKIFFSDTANNRVLFLSGSKVYEFLSLEDGIFQPTGLLYRAGNLYVLNTGKQELLKISSVSKNTTTGTSIDIDMDVSGSISAKTLQLEILPDDFHFLQSYATGDIVFTPNISSLGDTISKTANSISYTFSSPVNISGKQQIQFSPQESLSFPGSYYLKVRLLDAGGSVVYEKFFPYLTNGDDDITTLGDNRMMVYTGELVGKYYTQIEPAGSDIILKDLIHNTYIKLDSELGLVDTGSVAAQDMTDFEHTTNTGSYIVKSFDTSLSGSLLSVKLQYYKHYSCENPKDSILKTFIFKKAISY